MSRLISHIAIGTVGVSVGFWLRDTQAGKDSKDLQSGLSQLESKLDTVVQSERVQKATHPLAKYGLPVSHDLVLRDGYAAQFDRRTRNPHWVIERFSKDLGGGVGTRKQSYFREDPAIPVKFRNRLGDFYRSGYDRGHLVAAADLDWSQDAMNDTFLLTNISPQVGKDFNRDYWARFEKFVRSLRDTHDEVFVVTGTLFLPTIDPTTGKWQVTYPVIGQSPPPRVAVPTHFYKVVLTKRTDGFGKDRFSMASFIMPNEPIDPDLPVDIFSVPLDVVEEAAGTSFFEEVPRDAIRPLCSQTQCQLPEPNWWKPAALKEKERDEGLKSVVQKPPAAAASEPATPVATAPSVDPTPAAPAAPAVVAPKTPAPAVVAPKTPAPAPAAVVAPAAPAVVAPVAQVAPAGDSTTSATETNTPHKAVPKKEASDSLNARAMVASDPFQTKREILDAMRR